MKAGELTRNSSVRFGTSGLRGLVADLSDAVCFAYTEAFLRTVECEPGSRVALGMDLRPSSPAILVACAAAIRARESRVDFCGSLPTPALACYSAQKRIPAIMATGSHIPFDRNGIKFYRAGGEISKADEARIGETEIAFPGTIAPEGLGAPNAEAAEIYLDRYLSFFPAAPLLGMRIGFYQHSSAARDLFTRILEGLGAEVTPLGRSDEFVPIDTEAVSPEDDARAKIWARDHGFDALISTDGDADRPLLSDEHGNWLRGDVLGVLCASFLEADAVVTTINCNTMLEKCRRFPLARRTRIGSPHVIEGIEAFRNEGCRRVVGFEPNGGFLLGSNIERDGRSLAALPTRDAALPILCVLAAAKVSGAGISKLLETLPARFTASGRLSECPVEKSESFLASLGAESGAIETLFGDLFGRPIDRDETDGLRIVFENDEILHLRPSGNAPEFRVYAEANTRERANAIVCAALKTVGEKILNATRAIP
ncbi:MAG: phosphomannomutase [Candidatus Accumulibacter sp.]|jgi:phosphomannomutase|nr:phosphomannomutase [Accumulibacter sp.]